jgi:hypothetical protein
VVGKETLQHVRCIITNGDWDEYAHIDYAIKISFPRNALQGHFKEGVLTT